MSQGELLAIFIAPEKGGPCIPLDEVEAVAGRGLAGDRYFLGARGSGPRLPAGAREVTLIESEALEALSTSGGPVLTWAEARRNLVTGGIALNALVGQTFRVGEVVLRGVLRCDPCIRLERLSGLKVMRGLRERGGLRAQILQSGRVRPGDVICLAG